MQTYCEDLEEDQSSLGFLNSQVAWILTKQSKKTLNCSIKITFTDGVYYWQTQDHNSETLYYSK